jgi:hypothetical protein
MESERTQNFNERLNQWVASQGFWFQLRHSLGRRAHGAGASHFINLVFRLFLFLLVAGAGGFIFLVKRTDGEGYQKSLEASIISELGAKTGKLNGFQRTQGKMVISRLEAVGEKGSFFTEFEARNIGCRMNLIDGLVGRWDTGTITIGQLDIDLRAGVQDAESASKLGSALLKTRADLNITSIQVEHATVSWGYTPLTKGIIKGSRLQARPVESGWRLQFTGGTFSQNWLTELAIEELVVTCGSKGVVFEKALLKSGEGTLNLAGLTVKGAETTAVEGTAVIRNLPLAAVLPDALESFAEGAFSGTFKIRGSTNARDGIGFEGRVELGDKDEIVLRDRIHLLRALTVVDVFNNYRRVIFRNGSFGMKTGGGAVTFSDVSLKADSLMTLDGTLKVRQPTEQEKAATLERKLATEHKQDQAAAVDSEFNLKRAGKEAQKEKKGSKGEGIGEDQDRYEVRVAAREEEARLAEKLVDFLHYEGEFTVTLPPDAFQSAEKLASEFPKNPQTGRITMSVPIEGGLYDVTLKQADEIYRKGKR